MKQLSNQDLDRFAWEKMAPGIDEKIKKKRRRFYFFTFSKYAFGIIAVLMVLGIYVMEKDSDVIYTNQFGSAESSEFKFSSGKSTVVPQYVPSSNENEQPLTEISLDYQITHQLETDKIDLQNNNVKNLSRASNIDDEQFTSLLKSDNNSINYGNSIDASTENENIEDDSVLGQEVNSLYTNEVDNISLINHSELNNEDYRSGTIEQEGPLNTNLFSEIKMESSLPLVPSLSIAPLRSNEIIDFEDNTLVKIITPLKESTQSVEFTFNMNSLTKHPHTPLIGRGFSIGYWGYVGISQYMGFEFSFQQFKYRFEYPDETIIPIDKQVPFNTHKIYNIPIYYGYQIGGSRALYSLETGLNITLIKFSAGELSTISNSASILKLADENYFKKDMSFSFLFRGRVDYSFVQNYGVFARLGTNISLSNWYKDDSYQIKPIMINVDLGIRKLL
jgi:hypothetical protein